MLIVTHINVENDTQPQAPMSAFQWFLVVAMAGGALFFQFALGFLVFFSPGWANGWPFGLSFQSVISIAITIWLSIMLFTAFAGAGAIIGLGCAWMQIGKRNGLRIYRNWLWLSLVTVLCLSVLVFSRVYSSTCAEFPKGYSVLFMNDGEGN
jgi:hypothetical protein